MNKHEVKNILVIAGVIALFISLGLTNQFVGNMVLIGVIALSLLLHLFRFDIVTKKLVADLLDRPPEPPKDDVVEAEEKIKDELERVLEV